MAFRAQTIDDDCRLCDEPLSNNRFRGTTLETGCGHLFHVSCFMDWLPRSDGRCRVCQTALRKPGPNRRNEVTISYYPQKMEKERSFTDKVKMNMPYICFGILVLVAHLFIHVYVYNGIYARLDDLNKRLDSLEDFSRRAMDASASLSECQRVFGMCDHAVEEVRRIFRL